MSLQTRLNAFIAAVGADVKSLNAALGGKASTTHGHVLTDAAITGIIPDARLPVRLKAQHSNDVPGNDWNMALETGWYASSVAINSPVANAWHLGHVESHHTGWVTQTVHRFNAGDDANDTHTYRRSRDSGPADGDPVGGTWTAWYRLRIAEAEQDIRYMRRVYYTGAAPARPNGLGYVEWVGPGDPAANSIAGDTWIPTS